MFGVSWLSSIPLAMKHAARGVVGAVNLRVALHATAAQDPGISGTTAGVVGLARMPAVIVAFLAKPRGPDSQEKRNIGPDKQDQKLRHQQDISLDLYC